MKQREIKVSSVQEALKRMQAFLFANMLDNELEADDDSSEKPNYFVKLVWLSRDVDNKNTVGCPCFACSFRGMLPFKMKASDGIVYVKVFADKDYTMVKMHLVEQDPEEVVNYSVCEIEDGEIFEMKDNEKRYVDEKFLYKDGQISRV